MDELQTTMTIYRIWGSHLGSSQLFKQHLESRRRITEFVEKVQVRKLKTLFFISQCVIKLVNIRKTSYNFELIYNWGERIYITICLSATLLSISYIKTWLKMSSQYNCFGRLWTKCLMNTLQKTGQLSLFIIVCLFQYIFKR